MSDSDIIPVAVTGVVALLIGLWSGPWSGSDSEWEKHRRHCLCKKCSKWRKEMAEQGVLLKEPENSNGK